VIRTPQQIQATYTSSPPISYLSSPIFGQPTSSYYGTSSAQYGEVSTTGVTTRTPQTIFMEQYTSPDVDKRNIEFVEMLNPKIEAYKQAIIPYEERRLKYEDEVSVFNQVVGNYMQKPEAYSPEYAAALQVRAAELNLAQKNLLEEFNLLESGKGYTESDIKKAKNIAEAFKLQSEILAPQIAANEILQEKRAKISEKYYGGKDLSIENLNWAERAKIYIPFFDTKYEKDMAAFSGEIDTFNKSFKAVEPDLALIKIEAPLEKVSDIKSRVKQEAYAMQGTQITDINYKDFAEKRNLLIQDYMTDIGLSGKQTKVTSPDSAALSDFMGKVDTYETGKMLGSMFEVGTSLLMFVPGGQPVSVAAKGLTASQRAGSIALRTAKAYGQYKASDLVLSSTFPVVNYVGTGVSTGDWTWKDIGELKGAYRTALGDEYSSIKPAFGSNYLWVKETQKGIAEAAPFLTSKAGRIATGLTVFALSKGKVGKGIGIGLMGSGLTNLEGYLSNIEAYKASLETQGLSRGEIDYLVRTRETQKIKSGIELGLVSTQSELLGSQTYAEKMASKPIRDVSTKTMTKLYGFIPVKESFKQGYVTSGTALLTAGAYEGLVTTKIMKDVTFEKPTLKEYAIYGTIGAVSARTIGGTVIGLSTTRKALPTAGWREKGAMGYVYATDLNEFIGDRFADVTRGVQSKRLGIDVMETYIKPGKLPDTVSLYTGVTKGQRQPFRIYTPIDIQQAQFDASYSQFKSGNIPEGFTINVAGTTPVSEPVFSPITEPLSTPVSVRSSMPVSVRSNVPVRSSMPVSIRSNLPVNVPINLAINTPINVQSSMPINIQSPIEFPVSTPINVNFPITSPIDTNVPSPISSFLPSPVPSPVNINVNTPVNVPIVVPLRGLFLPFSFRDSGIKKGVGTKTKKKTQYTPDFISLVSGITSKSMPKGIMGTYTGQEIRPIIVK
jgi:hypothetical protein